MKRNNLLIKYWISNVGGYGLQCIYLRNLDWFSSNGGDGKEEDSSLSFHIAGLNVSTLSILCVLILQKYNNPNNIKCKTVVGYWTLEVRGAIELYH